MQRQYDEDGRCIGRAGSLSVCPYCGADWYAAKQERAGDDAPPMFTSLLRPTAHEPTRLTQLLWAVRCVACDGDWLQVMLCSPLFKHD